VDSVFGVVESGNALYADLGDGLLYAVLAGVVARLDLVEDLEVRALGQSGRILRSAAEDDEAMPGGL